MIPPIPIHEALALSTEAGWNQTAADWERILRLCGEACYSIEAEGHTVTTTAVITYGPSLAWIGMVLTTESQRGKGHARTLMQRAMADLEARKVRTVKLDASDLGRPVYAKLGFIDERPVSRWLRKPARWHRSIEHAPGPIDKTLDQQAFGADRGALLDALAQEEVYSLGSHGFALARPGRMATYFGPCVARDVATAQTLLDAFLTRHADEPALLDLCDDHPEAVRLAQEAGFVPVRRLIRMYLGDPADIPLGSGPLIYNLAGFEFG